MCRDHAAFELHGHGYGPLWWLADGVILDCLTKPYEPRLRSLKERSAVLFGRPASDEQALSPGPFAIARYCVSALARHGAVGLLVGVLPLFMIRGLAPILRRRPGCTAQGRRWTEWDGLVEGQTAGQSIVGARANGRCKRH